MTAPTPPNDPPPQKPYAPPEVSELGGIHEAMDTPEGPPVEPDETS